MNILFMNVVLVTINRQQIIWGWGSLHGQALFREEANMKEMLALLVVIVCLASTGLCQTDCPGGCFCITSRALCSNAGLTSFPVFSLDLQETVEEL